MLRLALNCRREIAVVAENAEFRWSDLSSRASDFAVEIDGSTSADQAIRIESTSIVDQLIGAWGTMLSEHPLFVPGSVVSNLKYWDGVVQARDVPELQLHGSWGTRIHRSNPAKSPAIAVQSEREPTRAHVWAHGSISRMWGVMAPRANSVGLASAPVLDQIGWSTTFAVLLGSGKVIASGVTWKERLDAVHAEGVNVVAVRAEELPVLLSSSGTYPSVEQVAVWSHESVSLDGLEALQLLFPRSEVRRCLYVDWGPLTVATLPQLSERGAGWVGVPVLGIELAAIDRGPHQRLLARSPMAAWAAGAEDHWLGGGEALIDTGMLIAGNSRGWQLLANDMPD